MNGIHEDRIASLRTLIKEHSRALRADPMPKTAAEVTMYVKKHDIQDVQIWFVDIHGTLKMFGITQNELEGALNEGMGFDGSSIKGYTRIQESDMIAKPDPSTFTIIPFPVGGMKSARMFADVYNTNGTPYSGDPRFVLKNTLASLSDLGLTQMNIGPEAEYFYFRQPEGALPLQHETPFSPEVLDHAGYFDLDDDEAHGLRMLTTYALEQMGIQVEYHHHEVGPSQHEIDLKYTDAMTMADRLVTYKWLVKKIAELSGVFATFMPKPIPDVNGSGMHTHLSLFKENTNAFFDANDEHHLSVVAKQFLAGVLHYAREMALVTNPTVNSYKRLVPGYEAPVYVAWASMNRSALVRVPDYKPGKEVATRIELRFPDPTANPYFAFAVMLKAGLNGMAKKMTAPSPVEVDIYQISQNDREKLGIESLPHDLADAIKAARESTLLLETLGEEAQEKLIAAKESEWAEYRILVHPWEYVTTL